MPILRGVHRKLPLRRPLKGSFRPGRPRRACVANTLANLNKFGLVPDPDFAFMRRMVKATYAICLFMRDSGRENVQASAPKLFDSDLPWSVNEQNVL